ncbi:hypothetical protein HBI56_134640 [Parastagonospora nodorum]|uniref:Uncharacterized protein n=2 Tax=Phaeosphaeria nodorum (strain SN15 / ATCC MYA-4574 / FGSC 10173) TaxID=321614 RepID=A0A7U2F7Q9_PHANO|nr:hypothetical protein SNOG_06845 [Parastagonospora nodorum SN15]KAH3918524.1 hypothetical protein HBH56_037740 [Parastagonospora nodorum]EAT85496.1 hypothetical protein SNOG_06845 [Parastagonospora nodorum SN15]KAH3933515.1 hypothetical protein HBH54_061720 [Parastagonospora nodorum]KAH3952324.1 hypothetical protein HBH53_048390 [Parastagonospora nodorum]KAH3979684.1 hypothetical protein HBH51_059390 [Parastagonospora nodorum]
MGNLCGKQSSDNFEGQGRTLGSAPAPATKASIPSNVAPKRTVGGPPRTLGESNVENDPKAAAAAAAEARNNKTTSGDLQKKLDAQKRQTNNQTLQQAAEENRRAREADQATETRNYN